MKTDGTAVIGAGSWGTALAILLGRKGEDVVLWGHRSGHLDRLKKERRNNRYLPGYDIPEKVTFEEDLRLAAAACHRVFMVVPSHCYRDVFTQLVDNLPDKALVVSAVKGIEIGTRMTMTQIMEEVAAKKKKTIFPGVLSGPSFAEEVAACQPTAVTVAFQDKKKAETIQFLVATDYFRAYTSSDVIGLEICGAMKNVIAIGAGICDGLGFGLNTRAALITRGLAEISRMGVAMGAQQATFAGLGGLGDLVLTCTGNLSRNRTVGLKLGQGKTLEQALDEMTMVAEGVKTTRSCYNLARELEVEMPILEQVYQVLYERKDCRQAVTELLNRKLKEE